MSAPKEYSPTGLEKFFSAGLSRIILRIKRDQSNKVANLVPLCFAKEEVGQNLRPEFFAATDFLALLRFHPDIFEMYRRKCMQLREFQEKATREEEIFHLFQLNPLEQILVTNLVAELTRRFPHLISPKQEKETPHSDTK